jgi:hypothetical protein
MINPDTARSPIFLSLLLALLAGCSTPAHRIKRNQAAFNAFPPEAQAQIAQGRVALGFTPDMVRIALGEPGRRTLRTTVNGEGEVWIYEGQRAEFSHVHYHPVYCRDRRGPLYYYPVTETTWTPYDRGRVEFANGNVVAVEGSP